MSSIDEIALATLADACNVDPSVLARDTILVDVGFDSLAATVFAGQMESAHGIPFDSADLAKLYVALTPADVLALVCEAQARSADAVLPLQT